MPAYFRFLTILAFHVFLQEKVSSRHATSDWLLPIAASDWLLSFRWTWPSSKSGSEERTTAPTLSGGHRHFKAGSHPSQVLYNISLVSFSLV